MLSTKNLKYLRYKYFVFLLKLMYYKIRFGSGLRTRGIWYGFEKDVSLWVREGGRLILGRSVYFQKRTDIRTLGGVLKIGSNVSFNKDCTVVCRSNITIGDNCKFGEMVSIYDHDHEFRQQGRSISLQGFRSSPISIGSNVWVGGKVFIKSGIRIGDNVVIGANSVITRDVPDNSVAVGNPARHRPIQWDQGA